VRLGGYAVGVFSGRRLIASKVGRREVHGRHRAGGQSQQRFARRRAGQARLALQAAADIAARVLLEHRRDLDAIVVGGDRRALAEVLQDPRLRPLAPLVAERVLDVPDPRFAVLQATPDLFRATVLRPRP
jgi:peptide subunit release factor 1 (eRF1)